MSDRRGIRKVSSTNGGVLVANRGEVAIRVMRAAARVGLASCAVYAEDDDASLHVRRADAVRALRGRGAAAYLDGAQLVDAAHAAGCTLVHPGYGFLSEDAAFARSCEAAGLTFVGPAPDTLALFGDKAAARRLALEHGVPVPAGSDGPVTLAGAELFLAGLGAGAGVMVKAVAGGGGRGMRAVRQPKELADAYERCRSEARGAFGRDEVYVEQLVHPARHVEVQVIGDGSGAVQALGERDCSLQRNHQKLLELAPAPGLDPGIRTRLADAALTLAAAAGLRGLCTFEFLVAPGPGLPQGFVFIEANPRLQVEHTVTEQVTGIDLVVAQLEIARGRSLAELGLPDGSAPPRRVAVEARVNMETLTADGVVRPSGGVLSAFEPPTGPGVRVDSYGFVGYRTSPAYDSLLAKVIADAPGERLADALDRCDDALAEFRVEGVAVNLAFLRSLLRHPEVRAGRAHTTFVEEQLAELLEDAATLQPPPFEPAVRPAATDPAQPPAAPEGTTVLAAPVQGTVIVIHAREGDSVGAHTPFVVIESMKMEHEVLARTAGTVERVLVRSGDVVYADAPLAFIAAGEVDVEEGADAAPVDVDAIPSDLAEALRRRDLTRDAARPEAVAKRHALGKRTARENLEQLVDAGSFREYGALAIAAQRARRPLQELIERTPADGLVAGIGRVDGERFGDDAHAVVLAYDYTVLAGTQGRQNHRKTDRMIALAERLQLPVIVFAEGGGGRPGDTDMTTPYMLDNMTFLAFARLSGLVPRIGIASGRCFAGNAAILGCCDLVIATADSSIGMAGPAAIEGGGLGVFRPEEVGPIDVQVPNGVVDLPVADEVEAVDAARRLLSYFQGPVDEWACADQRLLRSVVPENRRRPYDMRRALELLADEDSVLELRREFGAGMITAFARVEGRPLGVVANDPVQGGGAITADGADKAARFLRLCDAHGIPLLYLCDTPGIMVGPEVERTAIVRHCCRLFVAGASLTVPYATIVLRKAYGLGANAMTAGSFHAPLFTVAWPTGEFGGMNIEGSVKLGYRNELAAIEDPAERNDAYERMVGAEYEQGAALSMASYFEIDDVIDPAESRGLIVAALRAASRGPRAAGGRPPLLDTW